MRIRRETPSNLKDRNNVIEVKIWEAYFRHRQPILKKLLDHSIGKKISHEDSEKMSFRFSNKEWNDHVKNMLTEHNIPLIDVRHMFDSHLAEHH